MRPGFSPASVRDLVVVVGQTTVQNVQLSIGKATTEVTVTGAAPLVQTIHVGCRRRGR